jgi:hypothetical protein
MVAAVDVCLRGKPPDIVHQPGVRGWHEFRDSGAIAEVLEVRWAGIVKSEVAKPCQASGALGVAVQPQWQNKER